MIVTNLCEQVERGIARFVQALLDDPANAPIFREWPDRDALARAFWSEALVVAYRLLFLLKLDSSPDSARVLQFAPGSTPLLDRLVGRERAAATLQGDLSWMPGAGTKEPQRVPYASLDVEDLGRVHEALLALEPGIATTPMCRLRRRRLEVVVPADRGKTITRGKTTSVSWIEDIAPGRFHLRAGLGRKATGSYYTPRVFVRFLVEATLGPQVAERSPPDDPQPLAILSLKVLDPAMGAGHFLVEACRFLGDALLEACRRCESLATDADAEGDAARVEELRLRLSNLPDSPIGLSPPKAITLCRRLVAESSLYGVDEDPLAVLVARLSLWSACHAEGLPPTFLDHRLICGDSLTGPLFEDLGRYPKSGAEVRDRLGAKLLDRLKEAPPHWKVLAAAWSGGVMSGEQASDEDYAALMEVVAAKGNVETVLAARPSLRRMVEAGEKGVAYDLVFPEVFRAGKTPGFDAVVGNPPWDALQPSAKEFYAGLDLRVLDAPTRRERAAVEQRLSKDPRVQKAFGDYVGAFEAQKRIFARLYAYTNRKAGGAGSGAVTDAWQGFAERGRALLRAQGILGMVLPSAFHANQSAAGIRALLLDESRILMCFSYENRERFFDIDPRFKFALLVASREPPSADGFSCAFYLRDAAWLFGKRQALRYTRRFVERTGGAHRSFLELRAPEDVSVAEASFLGAESFGSVRGRLSVRLGVEIDMSKGAHLFTPRKEAPGVGARDGHLILHEGKTFHQYTDQWDAPPRYIVAADRIADKPGWLRPARHFRLASRAIANATNERTAIFAMIPPGCSFGNSALCERQPWARPNSVALVLLACANSYTFDWNLRQRGSANVNLFILDGCPIPPSAFTAPRSKLLAHAALRLTCNHEGYAPLFREQLDERASTQRKWPALAGDDERWEVRAAVDAVVADAYGLSREHYAHVLASFSHKSHPKAGAKCLAAFDELQKVGLEVFAREHDPYGDVPLVFTLP